jgi:hypothetical protein
MENNGTSSEPRLAESDELLVNSGKLDSIYSGRLMIDGASGSTAVLTFQLVGSLDISLWFCEISEV